MLRGAVVTRRPRAGCARARAARRECAASHSRCEPAAAPTPARVVQPTRARRAAATRRGRAAARGRGKRSAQARARSKLRSAACRARSRTAARPVARGSAARADAANASPYGGEGGRHDEQVVGVIDGQRQRAARAEPCRASDGHSRLSRRAGASAGFLRPRTARSCAAVLAHSCARAKGHVGRPRRHPRAAAAPPRRVVKAAADAREGQSGGRHGGGTRSR